jgi:hypothetical protein
MRAWFEVGAKVPDVTAMMMRSASPGQRCEAPQRAVVAQLPGSRC